MSINELHQAWKDADNAWQAELVKAFGKDAGNRRYDMDKSGHPRACRVAHAQKRKAWRAFDHAGGFDALFFKDHPSAA